MRVGVGGGAAAAPAMPKLGRQKARLNLLSFSVMGDPLAAGDLA